MQSGQMGCHARNGVGRVCICIFAVTPLSLLRFNPWPFSLYPNPLLQIPSCEGDAAGPVVHHGETTRSCAMERRWEQHLQPSRWLCQRRLGPNRWRLCQPRRRRRLWRRTRIEAGLMGWGGSGRRYLKAAPGRCPARVRPEVGSFF